MSIPAQNQGPYSVIVKLPGVGAISEKSGEGETNGTVSSVSPSVAGLRAGIPGKVAGNRQTTGPGSSISKNMSFLRADYAERQESLSGVRKFAQRRFPGEGSRKARISGRKLILLDSCPSEFPTLRVTFETIHVEGYQ